MMGVAYGDKGKEGAVTRTKMCRGTTSATASLDFNDDAAAGIRRAEGSQAPPLCEGTVLRTDCNDGPQTADTCSDSSA